MSRDFAYHSVAVALGIVPGVWIGRVTDEWSFSCVFMLLPFVAPVAACLLRCIAPVGLRWLNDVSFVGASSCGASALLVAAGWHALISIPIWWLFYLMPIYVTADYVFGRIAGANAETGVPLTRPNKKPFAGSPGLNK